MQKILKKTVREIKFIHIYLLI